MERSSMSKTHHNYSSVPLEQGSSWSNDIYELTTQKNHSQSNYPLISPSLAHSNDDGPEFTPTEHHGFAKFRRQFTGWRVGIALAATTTSIVCLLNLGLTIWAVSTHELNGGFSQLFEGSCSKVGRLSLWIHLGINAMSTLLLSASNYAMQILSSPTRKEVDRAHAKKKWLDIGIPSTRNLKAISWKRIMMWSALACSSIPLHLMYNTAIFSSLTANIYSRLVVTPGFLTNDDPTANIFTDAPFLIGLHDKAVNGSLRRLEPVDCMATYATAYVSEVRNVLLVSSQTISPSTRLRSKTVIADGMDWKADTQVPFAWICGDGYDEDPYYESGGGKACTLAIAQANSSRWIVEDYKIDYCMVEDVEQKCQLRFSLAIMIVVIISNLVKVTVMLITLWKFRTPTLVTIGDAMASFLEIPDPNTAGICLATRDMFREGKWENAKDGLWAPRARHWFSAASGKRWAVCNVLCIGFIIFGAAMYRDGMNNIGLTTLGQAISYGFGKVHPGATVTLAPKRLIPAVFFANLPQAVLSFLYLTYNGLYSCVLGAHEWTRYSRSKLPLRVTSPRGNQWSTYYLQLPYTYAIPLLLLSGGLHWLMSQSLFLALVDVYDNDGDFQKNLSISTVGYSCIAIFSSTVVGSFAILVGFLNGFRTYTQDIPLVGSCSAAISAACHRRPDDTDVSLKEIQWGCVNADAGEDVLHCTFSSKEVTPPIPGLMYAGLKME